MKELVNFFTLINDRFKKSGNLRLLYYIAITVFLLAAFLLLPEKEIGFIYNDF